jgi:FkbM family methyltransferase
LNSFVIKLRTLARKTGTHRLLYRMRYTLFPKRPYEQGFHQALEEEIGPGDAVWDVGANIGFYSELFLKWVGPAGFVVAFEPYPQSVERIRQRIPDCQRLHIEKVALGQTESAARLAVFENHSTRNHVQFDGEAGSPEEATIPVDVCTGDSVCARLERVPNVIKIDVEGFEEEVLLGLGKTLSSPEVRAVLLEVHFGVLASRGQANAPVRIEKLLRGKGFKTKWITENHLKAERK